MKRSVITLISTLVLGTSALAADMPLRGYTPVYLPPPPVFTWSGVYFGLNAGGLFANNKMTMNGQGPITSAAIAAGIVPGAAKLNKSGFAGGAQAGYNWQAGSFVAGVEADINYVDAKKTTVSSYPVVPGVPLFGSIDTMSSARSTWLATARLRAGFAVDRLLIFGTGGLAFGAAKNAVSMSWLGIPLYAGRESQVRTGWTVGGGLEYALTNNLTVKGEYLYYNLGGKTASINPAIAGGEGFKAKFKNEGGLARAGLNWKF